MRSSHRVVIVGTGGISRAHARVCQQNEQTDLVAVCDVSQAAVNAFAQQFAVERRYTVLEEMLEKDASTSPSPAPGRCISMRCSRRWRAAHR